MQKRALTALTVLAALGFGLLGAHPCCAWQERGEGSAPASPWSCHAGMAMKADDHGASAHASAPPHRPHHRDSSEDCGTSCRHTCHMTAVASAASVAFAIAPVAQAVVEASGFELPRFAHSIDHIPLA